MSAETQARRLIPWAWSAAWLLTGLGFWISDLSSLPSRSPFAYIAFSAAGWAIAGFVTASAAGEAPARTLRLVGWLVPGLASIPLSMLWLRSWNGGFLGPIAALGLAGLLGGVAGSVRRHAWRLVSGALVGLAFLLFASLSFIASYFLILIYTLIAQQGGSAGVLSVVDALIWPLPAALCGLGAGFAARWLLGLQNPGPARLLNLEK
jgi:hypothetical protein